MPHLPFRAYKHRWNPLSSQQPLLLDPRQSLYGFLLDRLGMPFDIRWLSHFWPILWRVSRVSQLGRRQGKVDGLHVKEAVEGTETERIMAAGPFLQIFA